MTRCSISSLLALGCGLLLAGLAPAQSLKLSSTTVLNTVGQTAQADYIVAVVNSEPITGYEWRREIQRTLEQLTLARRPIPDEQQLRSEVLENLISQKAQLQLAQETGIKAEDSAVDQSELNIAAQNQLSIDELHKRLQADGVPLVQFRQRLKDQITLQRLRERDVESRVRVTEADIDQYLADQANPTTGAPAMLNLAHILVAVPETADAAQVQALRAKAQSVLERARAGEDFASLAKEFSQADGASSGGEMGMREPDRYPELFTQAAAKVPVGGVAELVRSGAGFHVIKVLARVKQGSIDTEVVQTHVRHILLVPSKTMTEAQAIDKLADLRRRIVQGQADFASLARSQSQDGSAAHGGDLGWASPGMFVPEFEGAMNALAPGEISAPVVSRFGVHLIQVEARRKAALTAAQQREAARAMLREQKFDEAYRLWAQEVRARAYVELRDLPQS
jgi:peptidyl-prolyl cis-trans isomerase SurA